MEKQPTYIFDFDGTIADTVGIVADSQLEVLDSMGVTGVDRDDLMAMGGMRLEVSFTLMTGETDPVIQQEAIDHYHKVFLRRTLRDAKLFPGVIDTLTELRRRGAKIGVMTLRRREGFDKILAKLGLSELVDAEVCDSDVTHTKPATDMMDALFEALDADPGNTIFIGDTSFDIEMAHNSGAQGVAFTHGAHTRRVLELQKPLAVISEIPQLLDVTIN